MGSSLSKPGPTTEEEERRLAQARQYVKKNGLVGIEGFYKDQIESWKNVELNFAVTGCSGSGKSSFINAIRGINALEVVAVAPGVRERTVPNRYQHPDNEKIKLCDLPGIGTSELPNLKKYCKNLGGLEKYDAFLIFCKLPFSDYDRKLTEKVVKELRKPLFIVCTHVDIEVKKVGRNEETTTLKTIKKDYLKNLEGLVKDEMDIYVIDNKVKDKYDFDRLVKDISLKLPERRRECFIFSLNSEIYGTSGSTEEQRRLAQAREHVNRHGVADVDGFYRDQVETWRNVELNFAITGDSGSGKSSFINTVRGIQAREPGAAAVGVTQTTAVPTPYQHPGNENIKFWDLPGIGTKKYPNLEKYCEEIGGLEKYDAFLILCQKRFTNHDDELAKKISKELRKPFFLVRTHVDLDLKHAKEDEGPAFKEENTWRTMKEDCLENLEDLGEGGKIIYMIDNKVKKKYDFDRLVEDVGLALPERLRECFILSLTNVTRNCLKRKAKMLRVRAGVLAFGAGCVSAIPVPGFGSVLNLALILLEVSVYRDKFGFSYMQSEECEQLDEKLNEKITKHVYKTALELATAIGHHAIELGVEEAVKYIPGPGTIIASAASMAFLFVFLLRCIKDLEEAALEIWDRITR